MVAVFAAAPAAKAATALYPDLEVLPPRDLRLDRTDVAGSDSGATGVHNVLRFTNTVWNAGQGPLIMSGTIDPTSQSGPAEQLVRDTAGDTTRFPAGSFKWHEAHQHMHYAGWGKYELWKASDYDQWVAGGRSGPLVAQTGSKTTSCILDEEFQQTLPSTRFPGTYDFNGCIVGTDNKLLEGLSVGWGDTYDYWRHDQWIDLGQTTLTDGAYVLRTIVNPDDQIRESDKTDNDDIRRFRLQGGQIVDSDRPDGSVTLNDVSPSTRDANVSLKVIGRDDVSGIGNFRVSNDGMSWSPTMRYTSEGSTPTEMAWNLADTRYGGNSQTGTKTVYVQFQDGVQNWGASQTDTIELLAPAAATRYSDTVRAENPVSHWRLDEPSGVIATDAVGTRHGTYSGSPTLGAAGLLRSEATHTAVRFDGIDDSMSVPDSAPLDLTTAITLEAWIKPEALPAAGQFASVLSKRESYSLQFNGPRLELTVIQGGARKRLQADPGAIVVGETYHVVGTYDGATQRLYINGVQVKTAALTGGADATGNPVSVGSWGASEWFKGTIDEPAVYGAVLAPERVRAHYDVGGPPPTPPVAPGNPAAVAASSARVNVSWQDNSNNENAFVVERSTTAAFPADPTALNSPQDSTSLADDNLEPSKQYWYRVYARNSVGQSPPTAVVTATTQQLPAPSGLTATAASSSRVNLAWTDNSVNETDFLVERAANAQFTGTVTPLTAVTGTTTADTGLDPNQTYFYRVKARHSNGASSAWSNVPSATTSAVAPVVATSAATPIGETTATVAGTVNPQGAATTYRFEYGTTDFSLRSPATDASAGAGRTNAAVTAQLTGLAQATTYQYRLVATNAGGTTTSTPVRTFTTATPGAPSGLTATADAVSTTEIDLAWTDNSTSETGFVVERATSDTFDGAVALPAVTGTTLSDTGLAPNTKYWYRVKATYGSTATAPSNTAFATTRTAAPLVATSAATPIGETTATVAGTVNPQGAATTYRFEYGTTDFSLRSPATDASAGAGRTNAAATAQLTGLRQATTYQYRLVATNAGGTTTSTPVRTFTTATPAAPTGLTATADAASNTRIDLRWTDNSTSETGFVVERAGNEDFIGAVELPAVTGTTLSDTGLDPNEAYWYRVKARYGTTVTGWSNVASATTGVAPPGAATSAATGVAETTATIDGTVNPNGTATSYRFEYGTTDFGQRTPATDASAGAGRSDTAVTAELTGLAQATTYQYRLVATNAGGTASTPVRTFTTAGAPVPAAPANLVANTVSATQINLSWTDNSNNETGFVVQRAANAQFTGAVDLPAVTGTSTTDPGRTADTPYWYRVVARNASGRSAPSNTASATTFGAPAVTIADAGDVTLNAAVLSGTVDPRGAATTYRFKYGTTSAYGSETTNTSAGNGRGATTRSEALTGLQPSTTYHYQLVATNSVGTTASADRTFTTAAAPVTAAAPAATTGDAYGVEAYGANVEGTVETGGSETTWWFEYGTSPDVSQWQATPEDSAGSGSGAVSVTAVLGGLDPGTIYHYRLVASNAAGTAHGNERIFTTGESTTTPFDDPSTPFDESGSEPLPEPDTPLDVVGPRFSVAISSQRLDQVLRRGLKLRVKSNKAGRVTTRLLVAPSALGKRSAQALLVVGRGSKRLAQPGTATMVVKLTATARRLLARRRSVKLWVETTVTDADGNSRPAARTAVVLRAPRARARR
jgi:phosphodiesterase/alkaline phosphatase D-like protein